MFLKLNKCKKKDGRKFFITQPIVKIITEATT